MLNLGLKVNHLRQLSFRAKILLLIVPAIIGLLVFSLMRLSADLALSSSADEINELTMLSTFNSALVHEMQKELGATAAFIGTEGQQFGDILRKQRTSTDSALARRRDFIEQFTQGNDNEEINQQLSSINNELTKLASMRSKIDNLSVQDAVAIKFYTAVHAKMISMTATIAELSIDGQIANQLMAYYSFLEGKERAGVERAVLSHVFANDQFNGQAFTRFLNLVSEQNTYFSLFSKAADPELVSLYRSALADTSIKQVEAKRAIAMEKSTDGGFGVDPKQWFNEATGRINQLKKVEDSIAEYIANLTSEMASSASQSLFYIALGSLILLVVIVMLAVAIGRVINTQVMAIANSIIDIEKNGNLTLRIDVSTDDELGKAAICINKMLTTFQEAVKEIEQSSTMLAASSEESLATTESNMQNLQSQQQESQLIATAIEEMAASVQQVANSTSETATLVLDVDKSVDDSVVDMTYSRNEMEKLSSEMGLANDLILQLQESSTNINSVVEVIKSVADQTNLLALNAAIEAARAGEQGRGFAVVADEVRTLAKRTQDSTSEIESIVGKFQQDAASVSESIAKCSGEVNVAVEQTRKLETKLNNIKAAATAITDMSAQIATATEEQVAVANEMSININTVSDLSEQNAGSGTQLTAAGREQSLLATKLADLANRFTC
ncbi:MAG: methyl-accepting chemotaxis protein [Alteromonadaceae bacterium]